VPPGGIAARAELVATLEVEAPSLAQRFRLVDPAYEVPGAAGLRIAVYALADDWQSDDLATAGRPAQLRAASVSSDLAGGVSACGA